MEYKELFDAAFDALRKLLFPEEWLDIDLALSKSELLTLFQIDRNGEIIMSQIADYVSIPMSTATGLVERLVKKGYLERVRSDSDRRIVSIRLTQAGKALIEDIKETITGYIKYVFEALTEEERKLLTGIFFKVTDILSGKRQSENTPAELDKKVRKIEID